MFNTLFSALENTRSSISKAFNKLKSGSMSQEEIENIEEKLLLADIGYDTVESIIEIIKKFKAGDFLFEVKKYLICLLYTSPSPRDLSTSRMPSSA